MSPSASFQSRLLRFESLEERRLLTARATEAVNLFASDVYEQLQREQGNLFFSPLSIVTGLAMSYAGAAGQTAAEMEEVLHLGSEPGIHDSFHTLLSSLESQNNPIEGFELSIANAIWPQAGLPIHSSFLNTVETDYRGHAQSLNYSNPEQAEDTINTWVAQQTHGKIQDLVDGLSASTAMVLTNSVYFKGLWEYPFDPRYTVNSSFHLTDGETIITPMMQTQPTTVFTELDGFQVLEMPFVEGDSSMILLLPMQQQDTNRLSSQLLTDIDEWLESSPTPDFIDVYLPKFETTVSTNLNQLLMGLGMPTAFSNGGADFSAMTDAEVYIDKVFHKATIEVNEQGTEAAAATEVDFVLCFAEGTPVLTPDGVKPIEQLKVGDTVLARDEHNVEGSLQPKTVEKTLQGHAEILELHVGGQIIRTTAPHPFFAYKKGWTPAGELKLGDRLSTNHCDWVEVEKVVETNVAEPVYNLRVVDHRTYFVGNEAWGFAVWAHNTYGDEFVADHPFHFLIRDNTTSAITFMGRIDDPSQMSNNLTPTVYEVSADFDGDHDVDGKDFLAWQRGVGMTSDALRANGDSDNDGDVDAEDLAEWATNYGKQTAVQSAAIVASDESSPGAALLTAADPGLIDAAITLKLLEEVDEVTLEEDTPDIGRFVLFDIAFTENGEADQRNVLHADLYDDLWEKPEEISGDNSESAGSWLAEELLEGALS